MPRRLLPAARFLWYDLETFGRDPRRSRIAQFACLVTDADLDPLTEPEQFLCRLDEDVLPDPESCVLSGVSPQRCACEGLREPDFAARVSILMSVPGTCVAGFNNLRFDDEFIRHLFYRNFHDPYAREWQDGNSRFDLLDILRMAHALRPEGMEWPRRENGSPSFRLADLAAANDIPHRAHEALGDVYATVALARRLKNAQPRLWRYSLGLRDRYRITELLARREPLFHVSGRYPAQRGCAALVLPILRLDNGEDSFLVFDLDEDPQPLLDLVGIPPQDRTATRERLALLPPHALKRVRPNRLPVLARTAHVRDSELARIGIAADLCRERAQRLLSAIEAIAPRLRMVFTRSAEPAPDPELALYDGFFPDADRVLLPLIRRSPPEQLAGFAHRLRDARLRALLFRYRARHHPETLGAEERQMWEAFRTRRHHDSALSEVTADRFFAMLETLRGAGAAPIVLRDLAEWAAARGVVPTPTDASGTFASAEERNARSSGNEESAD